MENLKKYNRLGVKLLSSVLSVCVLVPSASAASVGEKVSFENFILRKIKDAGEHVGSLAKSGYTKTINWIKKHPKITIAIGITVALILVVSVGCVCCRSHKNKPDDKTGEPEARETNLEEPVAKEPEAGETNPEELVAKEPETKKSGEDGLLAMIKKVAARNATGKEDENILNENTLHLIVLEKKELQNQLTRARAQSQSMAKELQETRVQLTRARAQSQSMAKELKETQDQLARQRTCKQLRGRFLMIDN